MINGPVLIRAEEWDLEEWLDDEIERAKVAAVNMSIKLGPLSIPACIASGVVAGLKSVRKKLDE